MENIQCKFCKEEIKKGASVCPHCGKSQTMHIGTLLVAIILIPTFLLFVFQLFKGGI